MSIFSIRTSWGIQPSAFHNNGSHYIKLDSDSCQIRIRFTCPEINLSIEFEIPPVSETVPLTLDYMHLGYHTVVSDLLL